MNLSKGMITKEAILKEAFKVASKLGLESLSIGELAKVCGMSKSGLFGHFNSKERLQIMVLDFAARDWVAKVIHPAIKAARGIPRLEQMMKNWIKWSSISLPGGCPFIAAAIEYDDRPGPVRDHIVKLQQDMLSAFKRAAKIAVEEGQFRPDLDLDSMAFELYSFMVGLHIYKRLLKSDESEKLFANSFTRLIDRAKAGRPT